MEDERFNKLFFLYNKDVYRLSFSYVLNKFDAEDITQKTFYKLYKNMRKLSIPDIEVKRWLLRVAINESKDLLKSTWFKKIKPLDDNMILEHTENSSDLLEILKNLKKNERIVLYMFYCEGYNVKEISEVMNRSESAIKMRLSRGREQIKKEWSDQNEKVR